MIRFLRSLVPRAVTIRTDDEWADLRDRVREVLDDTRRAMLALPAFQERAIAYDPADGEVTVALDCRPRAVFGAYAVAQGATTPTAVTSLTWRPGSDARSVVVSAVGGLSSGTRYDVRLLVVGED